MDSSVINFAVYEDGVEYLGLAKLTLPTLTNKTITVNGAGIPGDLDLPVTGHMDAMKLSIQFIDNPKAAYKLADGKRHLLDCRVAHEDFDAVSGELKVKAYKHILEVISLSMAGGDIAPAASQGVSGEFTCLSRKDYIDGDCVLDYQPLNFVFKDSSGTDRLAAVRTALGK